MNEQTEDYLHYRAGCQHFLLHAGLHGGAADCGKVTHGVFSGYCLPCSRLPTHYDGLIPVISYGRREMVMQSFCTAPILESQYNFSFS